MTQSVAFDRSTRRHGAVVGAGPVAAAFPFRSDTRADTHARTRSGSTRSGSTRAGTRSGTRSDTRSGRRPGVLTGNEALFPDRAFAAAGCGVPG